MSDNQWIQEALKNAKWVVNGVGYQFNVGVPIGADQAVLDANMQEMLDFVQHTTGITPVPSKGQTDIAGTCRYNMATDHAMATSIHFTESNLQINFAGPDYTKARDALTRATPQKDYGTPKGDPLTDQVLDDKNWVASNSGHILKIQIPTGETEEAFNADVERVVRFVADATKMPVLAPSDKPVKADVTGQFEYKLSGFRESAKIIGQDHVPLQICFHPADYDKAKTAVKQAATRTDTGPPCNSLAHTRSYGLNRGGRKDIIDCI